MNIRPASAAAAGKARERVDSLVKPIGSLGQLEDYAVKLAAIFGKTSLPVLRKAVAVFAADNGVWDEGITPVPQNVTAMQAVNMTRGVTGVGVLAACVDADVFVYDLGIRSFSGHKGIEDKRIAAGTRNIAKGPAMDIGQAIKAIAHGIDAAEALWDKGYRMLGCGEMGICNTTTSAAVLCALTGAEPEETVGRGAGITDEQLEKKREVVRLALEINKPDPDNTLEVLATVGGFDIAAMTGFFLGAAYKQVPVVIDGFISAVAAVAASRLSPAVTDYMFASHHSEEIGFDIAMEALELSAPLKLNMRLGEGSGCPLMFAVLDGAAAVLMRMATFAEARIDPTKLVDIRK
jgi:nicotinate-nucleotide--dimethylbenzimidazole phosphoribosyltransferase